jgi:3-oxoacid CoA-transferase subunit A
MIKNWVFTGDTHGGVGANIRISNIHKNMPECKPSETGVIILGDAGLNFYLNKTDKKQKRMLNSQGYTIYCVRGNHEERPENIDTYHLEYDANVGNMVWVEEEFPNIKFFADGGNYVIDGHPCLVIGGGYSVDKYWRLRRAGYSAAEANIADPKKCGWFKDECLTQEEMTAIFKSNQGKKFDFVLSHTCPYSWQPTDLFLGCIDQSTVDNSMEIWMDELKETFNWNIWLFGHFHADRIERPHVEQMYMDYELLDTIWNRWNGEKTFNKEWWLPKSPVMEMLELEGAEFNG